MNFGDYKFGEGNDDPWASYQFPATNLSSQSGQSKSPEILPPVEAEHEILSSPPSGSSDAAEPKNDHSPSSPWNTWEKKEDPQPQIARPMSPKLIPAFPAPEFKQSSQLLSSTPEPVKQTIPHPVQPVEIKSQSQLTSQPAQQPTPIVSQPVLPAYPGYPKNTENPPAYSPYPQNNNENNHLHYTRFKNDFRQLGFK